MVCRNILSVLRRNFIMVETKTLILTVARHGQTDSNKERRLQGQIDTPLNELGEQQAQAAGQALKNVKFHKAYSSDLKRANKTCKLILSQSETCSNLADQVIQDKLVSERNFGEFENKLVSEYEAIAKAANVKMIDYNPEKGETRETVRNRARKFIKEIVVKDVVMDDPDPHVLVVTHGGLLRELYTVFFEEMGCPYPPNSKPGDHKKLARNTSWSRFQLEIAMDNFKIKDISCQELNNADHLDKE